MCASKATASYRVKREVVLDYSVELESLNTGQPNLLSFSEQETGNN